MVDKGKAIDKLQALKGDAKGLEASVFNACIQGIKEMPEDATADCCVKTADEMFREFGYEKCDVLADGEIASYHSNNEDCDIIIYKSPYVKDSKIYIRAFSEGEECGMNSAEILACAQLIREMEAGK